jgi:hypothetical protein
MYRILIEGDEVQFYVYVTSFSSCIIAGLFHLETFSHFIARSSTIVSFVSAGGRFNWCRV